MESAVKIQSFWRGVYLRKKLMKMDDDYDFDLLNECIDKYLADLLFNEKVNKRLSKKKRRNENFPSDISENVAKLALAKKHKIMPSWYTEKGDLMIKKLDIFKQIEVKGFMSEGPSSFGPAEGWDWILWVDGIDIRQKHFKVYEIRLSNESPEWRNIVLSGQTFSADDVPDLPDNLETLTNSDLRNLCKGRGLKVGGNTTELINRLKTDKPGAKFPPPKTYGAICDKNSRGELRACFDIVFKPQLGDHCKLIFDGHVSELNV